jgi:TolB-like protein/DNA-binding winged helix-turn-helix (wHTH) protein
MDARTDPTHALSPIDLAREPDFALGQSRVAPSTREVLRGSERELLEPRLMQVLVALFQANGRVVSRDELIARCWEGRIVGEDAINRAISRLRRLSEVDQEASFQLETIPKVGYRLIAKQSLATTEAGPAGDLPAVQSKQGGIIPALVAVAALVLVAVLFWFYPRPVTVVASSQQVPVPARTSVAVLPFLNLSGDPKEEYFSDGMTEEITAALVKIPKLPVVGRTSAFQFKGKAEDLRAIGRALNAAYLLEGSVRKADNRVRVTAQLVRADTGDHVWTESYDRELRDVFSVQEDVAQAIAQALKIPLGLRARETLVSDRTTDTNSYQDYLRARAMFRARK